MKRQLNLIFTSFGKRLFIREVITVYKALIAMILSLSSVLFLCVNLVIGICEEIPNTEPALLIVSYDGFRPDYLNRNVTPNLNKFRTEGTTARYMNPVFPTKTFVNHFSIATGLYAGNHGVLGNTLYDTELGSLKYGYDLYHYNESVIPIWTANELAGKNSVCMWPGGEYEYNGVKCKFSQTYEPDAKFEDLVDTIMSWFMHKKTPANLAMLYIDQPDGISHIYGPDNEEVTKMIERVDNLTGYIQQKLIENKLENRVNVIHLSDHGISGVSPPNFINFTHFIADETYKFYGSSPTIQIVPEDSAFENEIFVNLTKAAQENGHFKVYNEHNLPTRWHANNAKRMGPILVAADIGYAFQDQMENAKFYEENFNVPITNETVYGVHGYDSAEPAMRAFFMAKGPLISKGKRIKAVNMIDLYNLFCLILNIECGKNDGSNDPSIWNKLFAKYNNIEKVMQKYHQN